MDENRRNIEFANAQFNRELNDAISDIKQIVREMVVVTQYLWQRLQMRFVNFYHVQRQGDLWSEIPDTDSEDDLI